MAAPTYNQLDIRVRWTPAEGSHAAMGTYTVDVLNLRVPQWWNRPWKLMRQDRAQFKSAIDEMKWAIDELHTRMHGGRLDVDFNEPDELLS